MKDIPEILKSINGILKEKSCFSTGVYKDEPIIKPASGMGNYVPADIAEIAEMMKSRECSVMPRARMFVTVGRAAENITDNCEKITPFSCYYPTYRDMSRAQLRTYFTWRTGVRAGKVTETSYSYVFVYIYELISLIGVKDAADGFHKLKRFMLDYSAHEPAIMKYYERWLTEFAVYYDLPAECLGGLFHRENDCALDTLIKYKDKSDEELFAALITLSSYRLEDSAFYKEYPTECAAAVCGIYRAWADYYGKNRTKSLAEKLFGVSLKRPYSFFEDAVFLDDREQPDREYFISPLYRFECRNGSWSIENYPTGIKKNSELGAVIKETDRILRREYGCSKQLRESLDNKTVIKIIEAEIKKLLEEKREKERSEIKIDVSALERIRQDADITRDMLMTAEEAAEDASAAAAEDTAPEGNNGESVLDEAERGLMRLLLSGGDINGFAREKGIMLSVICESINEKLYDIIGDIVIEFDGDRPYIIEDYTDEAKELL